MLTNDIASQRKRVMLELNLFRPCYNECTVRKKWSLLNYTHQPNSPQETFEATSLQSNSLGLDKQQRNFYKIRQTQ